MSTDADIGAEFEQIQENWTADEAPKRRGRGRPPRDATSVAPLGRTFTRFEAKNIIKEITTRISDIRAHGSDDEYAGYRADLLQEIVDHLKPLADGK
jgi:hypothetical protein